MADAAIKEYNKILNLLDPPKDLGVDGTLTNDTHGPRLKEIIQELFWPSTPPPRPAGFKGVGDTKNAIKNTLGAEGIQGKPFSEYIANKASKLRILRETHSTGEDGRPSGLYISQDSGPGVDKLVKGAHIIITPGTIMDPASKTKVASVGDDFDVTNFVIAGKYTSLPTEYVEKLSMNTIITGAITMVNASPNYHVTIPYKFGDAATDNGTIDAYLKHSDFKKATDVGANDDGDFFLGNDTKNTFIASNYLKLTEKNKIKKYILVKELGDTLQVSWLKYIITTSDDAKTALETAGAGATAAQRTGATNNPYTSDKTAIITGDTIVWYRSMVNKVPVFLTWKGETNFWRASDNDAFMIAAFKKTIREQLITDNQCVIDIIKEISSMGLRGPTENWISNLEWQRIDYTLAKDYLSRFANKLENLNKDALIYVDNVSGIEATKEAAKKYHFNNPFVKKGGIWKPNEKVLSILANGDIKFYAKAFTAPSIFKTRLENPAFFMQLPVAGGGQKGGARRTPDQKATQASTATTAEARKKYYTDTIAEFTERGNIDLPAEYTQEMTTIQARAARAKTKRDTVTVATPDVTAIDGWSIFANSSDLVHDMLKPNENVLYLFVRDYFPEVFTYAAMMKQAFDDLKTEEYTPGQLGEDRAKRTAYANMSSAFPNVSLDLKTRYPLEYTLNERGEMKIEGSVAGTPAATLSATKEALYLAHKFISYYDSMPSKDLLAFVSHCVGNINILSAAEISRFNTAITEINYAYVEDLLGNQGGGGNITFDPILSSAMDNYELYYSLYVQAAYEDRVVTDKEFQAELLNVQEELRLTVSEMKKNTSKNIKRGTNYSEPSTPLGYNSNSDTIVSNASSVSLGNNWRAIPRMPGRARGGRYRKTQKKRKSSRKQTKRKTRRHKK